MYGWLTFYHQGHEVANDFTSFNLDLQRKLQKTRESLEITNSQAETLMRKMLDEVTHLNPIRLAKISRPREHPHVFFPP